MLKHQNFCLCRLATGKGVVVPKVLDLHINLSMINTDNSVIAIYPVLPISSEPSVHLQTCLELHPLRSDGNLTFCYL